MMFDTTYWIGTLIFALDLIVIASVLVGHGTVLHKLLWIVLVLAFPVVGMILYFLLGRSRADA